MPWRRSRVGEPRGRAERRLGRVVAARAPAAARRRGPSRCSASAPGLVADDRRDDVARAVGRQLGAEHDGAARRGRSPAARRGGRSRAARGPGASAGPPGTSRAGSARPPPWPPRRRPRSGEATAARCRNSAASGDGRAPPPRSSTTAPTTSSPDAIGTSAASALGHLRRAVLRRGRRRSAGSPRARPTASRRRGDRRVRAAGRRSPPARRRPRRRAPPRARGRRRRGPRRPSRRWTARRRSTSEPPARRRRRRGGGGLVRCGPPPRSPQPYARPPRRRPGGPGGSPPRPPRCARGRPRRPGMTNTLPSPTAPVRACLRIVSTIVCTSAVGDDALELDLRPQVVRQLRAAVALGDALLPARALDLADRQRGEARGSSSSVRIGSNASWRMYAIDHLHVAGTSLVVGGRRADAYGAAHRRSRTVADELGRRDELLRVPVHAVLGDVEAGVLRLLVDAQADGRLDDPEGRVGQRRTRTRTQTDGRPPARPSWPKLAASRRGRRPDRRTPLYFGEARRGEEAAGERAPDARQAVRRERADRVVELLVDRRRCRATTMMPATAPMIGAAQNST